MKVTLLTVGEYPAVYGLHASQVLPFGVYLRQHEIDVQWIAFLPIESRVKDLFLGGSKLAKINDLADQNGVDFFTQVFPITISRIHSYFFRKWLIRKAGQKLAKILIEQRQNSEQHIIHCRSYFATAVALEAKKIIGDISVSFDMRSLLPPEIPLIHPYIGKFFYGSLKSWEAELLEASDFSFFPCHRGIKLLELEGVRRLPNYVPIIGFEVAGSDTLHQLIDLENPVIGYIGSFGVWQSPRLLEKIFDQLAINLPTCSFQVLTESTTNFKRPVSIRAVSNQQVKQEIKNMLALIVPGPEKSKNYFSSMKLSANFFSTKAAEALSLGIPLIVNSEIKELADYVRSYKCGLVFSIKGGDEIQFESIENNELSSLDLWNNLHDAAKKCTPEFRRSSIFEKYLRIWREA